MGGFLIEGIIGFVNRLQIHSAFNTNEEDSMLVMGFMPYGVKCVQFRGGSSAIPTVTITVVCGSKEHTDAAMGETMEDAIRFCVARVMRVDPCSLESMLYEETDRGVMVSITVGSCVFSGVGMHNDVWVAIATGLVQACNSAIEAGAFNAG